MIIQSKGSFSYSSLPYNHRCCSWQYKEHSWMTWTARTWKASRTQMDGPVPFEKTKTIMSCMNKCEIHFLKILNSLCITLPYIPFVSKLFTYPSRLEAWFLAWNPHVWIRSVLVTELHDFTFISSCSLWKYNF